MSRDFFVADFEFTQYTKRMGRPRGFFSEIIENRWKFPCGHR